ncbi:nitroreductase [Novosphingobium sp. PS1R-30]|uniref:Nitroreductase n=1 Tax=Novosphingobium anseongense TaxID=3133436 RepID=A0ABU8S1E9_9SPHN
MGSIERQDIRAKLGEDGTAPFRSLADLLERRFSCRAFLPDEVPRAVLEQMVTLAQMTPSWANTQPWQVTITSGAATQRLREALLADFDSPEPFAAPDLAFPDTYSGARLDRRREVGWQLYESTGVAKGDREASARQARENQRLFGAPHALLIHTNREMGTYGAMDCGLYLGNLLLAAESLGLGMIAQAALAQHCGVIRDLFGIPDDTVFVVGGSIGYPDRDNPVNQFRSRRAPFSESITWLDE